MLLQTVDFLGSLTHFTRLHVCPLEIANLAGGGGRPVTIVSSTPRKRTILIPFRYYSMTDRLLCLCAQELDREVVIHTAAHVVLLKLSAVTIHIYPLG